MDYPHGKDGADYDVAEAINQLTDGWKNAMGVTLVKATGSEVIAEITVGAAHLQPLGVVHGGVYSGLIETVASVGAAVWAMQIGKFAVGLENHTSFLRAVRGGTLRAIGKPLVRGQNTHVWEGEVRDDRERLVATGRVRLMLLDRDAALAGEKVTVKT